MATTQDDASSGARHPLGPLTLTGELLGALERQTQETYLADSRPWVIGYSGGKDSTVAVQHTWQALAALPREKLTKPVYVISSDTLVESPIIVKQIRSTLQRIEAAAARSGLPFQTDIVQPDVRDTFWVNLIGRGYPAPYKRFRWCTDRMKIQPANRFIKATAEKYGEVVLVLGVRRTESTARAQVMSSTNVTEKPSRATQTCRPRGFTHRSKIGPRTMSGLFAVGRFAVGQQQP